MDNSVQLAQAAANGIRKDVTKSKVTVDSVAVSMYQKKGTLTATLRQVFDTIAYYPALRIANNMQDSIFDKEDFGNAASDTPYASQESRIAWVNVPLGTTTNALKTKLKNELKDCHIYRVLSFAPILTSDQESGIAAGLTTKDIIANSQAVRYPDAHDMAGQLILIGGRVQYRQCFFSQSVRPDQDLRTNKEVIPYVSEELEEEVQGLNESMTLSPSGEGAVVRNGGAVVETQTI